MNNDINNNNLEEYDNANKTISQNTNNFSFNQTMICPNCGKEIRKESRNCIHCGQIILDNFNDSDKFKKTYKKVHKNSFWKKLFKKKENKNQLIEENISVGSDNDNQKQNEKFTFGKPNVNLLKKTKKTDLEKKYGRKKLIITLIILIVIAGTGYYFYKNNTKTKEYVDKLPQNLFIKEIELKLGKLKKDISKFECSGISQDNNYYYKFSDITIQTAVDAYSGYVRVDKSNSTYKYYITYSNGMYGVENILDKELTADKVTKIKSFDYPTENIIWCKKPEK